MTPPSNDSLTHVSRRSAGRGHDAARGLDLGQAEVTYHDLGVLVHAVVQQVLRLLETMETKPEVFNPRPHNNNTNQRPQPHNDNTNQTPSTPQRQHKSAASAPQRQHKPEATAPQRQHKPEAFSPTTTTQTRGLHPPVPQLQHKPDASAPQRQHKPKAFSPTMTTQTRGLHNDNTNQRPSAPGPTTTTHLNVTAVVSMGSNTP